MTSSQPIVDYASRTDVGMRRSANQDSLAVRLCQEFEEWHERGHLFLVADGMGGHSVGDLASRITVETLPHSFAKLNAEDAAERLRSAVLAANRAINDRGRENPEFADMGTTCSALALSGSGAWIGHVGDSRIYRVRNGLVQQLTFDHSLQWEMIRQGRATLENVDLFHPRNVITRCLGPEDSPEVDVEGPFSVQQGDRFVLCSDGLTNHVTDAEMGAVVTHLSPKEATRLLIHLTNSRGGSDNVTAIVTEVRQYPPLEGKPVDSVSPPAPPGAGKSKSQGSSRSLNWLLPLAGALSLTGIGFVFADRRALAIASLVPAGILVVLQLLFRMTGRSSEPNEATGESEAGALKTTVDGKQADAAVDGDSSSILSTSMRPGESSPYRTVAAAGVRKLVDEITRVQGDLLSAGRESAWDLDLDRITSLSQDAGQAEKEKRYADSLKLRSQAIELLMREYYRRARKS